MENAPAQIQISRLEAVVFATPFPKMPVLAEIDELSPESGEEAQAWKFACSDIFLCFQIHKSIKNDLSILICNGRKKDREIQKRRRKQRQHVRKPMQKRRQLRKQMQKPRQLRKPMQKRRQLRKQMQKRRQQRRQQQRRQQQRRQLRKLKGTPRLPRRDQLLQWKVGFACCFLFERIYLQIFCQVGLKARLARRLQKVGFA